MATRTVTVWVSAELNAPLDEIVSNAVIFVDRPITAVVDATIDPITLNARLTKTRQVVGDGVGWWWQQYVARHEALRKIPKELSGYIDSPIGIPYGEFIVVEMTSAVVSPAVVMFAKIISGRLARAKLATPIEGVIGEAVRGDIVSASVETSSIRVFSRAAMRVTLSAAIETRAASITSYVASYRLGSVRGVVPTVEISTKIVSLRKISFRVLGGDDLILARFFPGNITRGRVIASNDIIGAIVFGGLIANLNISVDVGSVCARGMVDGPTILVGGRVIASTLGIITSRIVSVPLDVQPVIFDGRVLVNDSSTILVSCDRLTIEDPPAICRANIETGSQSIHSIIEFAWPSAVVIYECEINSPAIEICAKAFVPFATTLVCVCKVVQPSTDIKAFGDHDPDDEDALTAVLLAA